MADDPLVRFLRAQLAERRWRQSDLVRRTGIDKNTISALLAGRTRPSDVTLGKIEGAFDLTPGTLAGVGEDALRLDELRLGPDLSQVPDEALLTELTARVRNLKTRLAELEQVPATEGTPVEVDFNPYLQRNAAREIRAGDQNVKTSKLQRDPQAHAGEESQDTENWDG